MSFSVAVSPVVAVVTGGLTVVEDGVTVVGLVAGGVTVVYCVVGVLAVNVGGLYPGVEYALLDVCGVVVLWPVGTTGDDMLAVVLAIIFCISTIAESNAFLILMLAVLKFAHCTDQSTEPTA
jgi:hypothetical protein